MCLLPSISLSLCDLQPYLVPVSSLSRLFEGRGDLSPKPLTGLFLLLSGIPKDLAELDLDMGWTWIRTPQSASPVGWPAARGAGQKAWYRSVLHPARLSLRLAY